MILVVAPTGAPVTGMSLASTVFVDYLRERGNEVEVVELSVLEAPGASALSRLLHKFRAVIRQILHTARSASRADVIYFTVSESRLGNAKDLIIMAALGRHLRRCVLHLHGGAAMRALLHRSKGLTAWVNIAFVRRAATVVVLGRTLRSIYSGVLPENRIVEVANFALPELLETEYAITERFKADGPIQVLFLSNLLEGKGHFELVEAARLLEDSHPGRFVFRFAGAFSDDTTRSRFLQEVQATKNCQYVGFADLATKQALLRESHVLALPTYYAYEGQPICILEAYAAGCVVVTTEHSGIPDVFADGINGFAVAPRDKESLARALARVASDPVKACAIAVSNRSIAGRAFTIERYNEQLAVVLDGVAVNAQES